MGEVEVDEVFIGGKEKNKHKGHHRPHSQGGAGKTEVIGAIARKGNVVCQIINRADTNAHQEFVKKVVSKNVSLVSTDEARHYWYLDRLGYTHEMVKHKEAEYVRGRAHTQSIESFWSLLRTRNHGIVSQSQRRLSSALPVGIHVPLQPEKRQRSVWRADIKSVVAGRRSVAALKWSHVGEQLEFRFSYKETYDGRTPRRTPTRGHESIRPLYEKADPSTARTDPPQ